MHTLLALVLFVYIRLCTSLTEGQAPLSQGDAKPSKRLSFQDVLSGSLRPEYSSLQWTSTGKDGSYLETNRTKGDLWLAHVLEEERELLVNGTKLQTLLKQNHAGAHVNIREYKLQPAGRKVLISTNYTKLYRWSGFTDFYVYDPSTGIIDMLDGDQVGDIQFARWSPKGDSIVYVRENNLYVNQDGKRTRITNDGSPDIFNGIPDWVYEEEIFASTDTTWYSPDGRFVAFLSFNDTGVPIYRVPYYMTGETPTAYPRELELRYPKAGQTIPTVSLHLVDLQDLGKGAERVEFDAFSSEDLLIGEVAWITEGHSHLAWRCFNRVQDHDKLMVLEVLNGNTFIAAERQEKHAWIDNLQSMRYVPRMNCFVYLSDEDGTTHIYLQYVNGTKSLQLTSGEWEVTKILHVSSSTVFYQSTERDSTERHIYSLELEFLTKKPLVNDSKSGFYDAVFSSKGGFYVLSYDGPDMPRQEVYSMENITKPINILQDNAKLAKKLSNYNLPHSRWTTIKHPDGFELNVMETLPPNFDSKKKYPLLLNPYGGPGSQQTTKTFRGIDWWAYVASDPALEYVVLTVDGRGTGFKGKDFRSVITGKLGFYEAQDQALAAEMWSNKSYIDPKKVTIQGWSYGGYLSLKAIELNSDVFSSAIVTAPVSSWTFYDAFYTERYMKSPLHNPEGYYNSSVHDTTGFNNVRGGILLQHGTGDDNVHFQNSAVLVDLLMTGGESFQSPNSTEIMKALAFDEGIIGGKFDHSHPSRQHEDAVLLNGKDGVSMSSSISHEKSASQKPVSPSKLTVQWFTDSDHGINFHGSSLFLRKQMAKWLYREKRRREPNTVEEDVLWLSEL